MAKKSAKQSKKGQGRLSIDLLSHPATTTMLARTGRCNKPPILWRKHADGSWLECFLLSDCTYGNCKAVDESEVPEEIRNR